MKQTIEIEVPNGYKAVYNEDTQKVKIVKIELPKTWEEFCEQNRIKDDECYIDVLSNIKMCVGGDKKIVDTDKNLLPNKETAEAFLALMQLIQLRDCYRQGWKPDWTDNNDKYVIDCYKNSIRRGLVCGNSRLLSFETEGTINIFLENFRELIEKAKELI